MSYLVYINGELIPAEEAKISVFDAAYLYGEGLFETLRAFKGHIPFLGEHLKRLYRGARLLRIAIPLRERALAQAMQQTLAANELTDAYIRVNVSAEEASVGTRRRHAAASHIVIFAKPPDPYPQKLYRQGCRLVIVRSVVNDPAVIATCKTTNYLAKMIARREIQDRRATEGILLNSQGEVTEGAGSNLFLVRKGKLLTPPISAGVMPGVIRRQVLKQARRLKIPTRERSLTIQELLKADEIFITSTLKGVMPVVFLERRRIGKTIPGPITRKIISAYQKLILAETG